MKATEEDGSMDKKPRGLLPNGAGAMAGRALANEKKARNVLAARLMPLYRVSWLRERCFRLIAKLEGGSFYSKTIRDLLRRYHGVDIGPYSYGPVLIPGTLPRGTKIGAYCSVGAGLIVRRRDHPFDRLTQHPFFYNSQLGYLAADSIPADSDNPLTIGNDVWIGDRVTILSGCRHIGDGAILAAGAVVTRDIEPYSIVGGVPARMIKMRFDKITIARLQRSCWWELSLSSLCQLGEALFEPLTPATLNSVDAARVPSEGVPRTSDDASNEGSGSRDESDAPTGACRRVAG